MGRGRGVPLRERRRPEQPEPEVEGLPERTSSRRVAASKHVWVVGATGQPGRWPGLLVEWRRGEGGSWEARVVYTTPERDGDGDGVRLIERWLPGAALQPAGP